VTLPSPPEEMFPLLPGPRASIFRRLFLSLEELTCLPSLLDRDLECSPLSLMDWTSSYSLSLSPDKLSSLFFRGAFFPHAI